MFLLNSFILFAWTISPLSVQSQSIDLSGNWQLSYRMPDGKEILEISVIHKNTIATAECSIGEFEMNIEDNKISWVYPLNFRKGKELASFEGTIKNDDYLKGVFIVHQGVYSGRAVKWKARRIVEVN